MTAVAIALGILAWILIVLVCLGLARSAAFSDEIARRRTRRRDRRAA